ncbi:MAG: hypothetical protein DLM59_19240 [Pseudonocardiales bacterium]|nr:MAG: hypothetical protein DLM59_19240 [Pseudonocardiales bacterium]
MPGGATTSLRKDGLSKSPVAYLDFTVNGTRLLEQLHAHAAENLDYVGVIQDAWPVETVAAIERLLGQCPGDLPDGRVSLYVCPECGRLGCGALTARVALEHDTVTWRAIGIQTDYEEDILAFGDADDFPDIAFERSSYEHVLRRELARVRPLTVGFEYPYQRERRLRRKRLTRLLRRLIRRG